MHELAVVKVKLLRGKSPNRLDEEKVEALDNLFDLLLPYVGVVARCWKSEKHTNAGVLFRILTVAGYQN